MIDRDERDKYFGFEITIPPHSDIFKNACLRAPDLILKISLLPEDDERWLVLWKSYENDLSERGLILKNGEEIERKNCLSLLPLSVVLFRLAEEPDLKRVCTRFFSIVPRPVSRKNNCDIPPLNWRLLKDSLSINGNGIELHVCTPRQFKSFYRLRTLDPVPVWNVQTALIEEFAWELFKRASTILSLIHHEKAFQCLLPVFTETINYGGLLLGFFEEKNDRVSREVAASPETF